jgi:uncharacterized SAM-binding protein YcdF (DUF218 family)
MTELTAAFLKRVGDYMLVSTPLARADVCLVFGNNIHPDHLAEQAADLYHRGFFNLIVVSGGPPTGDGRIEAHRMRDVLVEKGVPEKNILVEDKAMNTGENVTYSMELLDKKVGLDKIDSVIAIGHVHAARRFLMTMEKQWPQVQKMFTTVNCFGVPLKKWHTDPSFRAAVLVEYEKIPDYKARGYISEIDVDKMRKAVLSLPKSRRSPKPRPK